MNPRDEKILLIISKKQRSDYGNFVPFCVIQKHFPWLQGIELTQDLSRLTKEEYLLRITNPANSSGWWYKLTATGKRECERIKYENAERRKNRNVQIISSIIAAVLGFLLSECT